MVYFFMKNYFYNQCHGGSPYAMYAGEAVHCFWIFWSITTAQNVLHCCCTGTFGCWFFDADQGQNPVWRSLKRAVGPSFGSICFASLVVAAIKTLKKMLRDAQENAQGNIA